MSETYGVVGSVQVAPVAGWIWWLPDSSGPQSTMSAVRPATVLSGSVPGGFPPTTTPFTIWVGVLIELINSQLFCPRACRKAADTVLKSGFLVTGIPVFHAWKQ